MTTGQEPEKKPWWRRVGAWIGGAILGGLAATIHEWTKPGVLEAVARWAVAPSGLPNGIAVAAICVLLVPLCMGCIALARLARSRSPAFTRGVYQSGYWRWEYNKGEPARIEPVCPFDQTPLTVGAGDYRDDGLGPVDLDTWDCSRCRFHAVAEDGWEARVRNQIRGDIDSKAWRKHRAALPQLLKDLRTRSADKRHYWDMESPAPTPKR